MDRALLIKHQDVFDCSPDPNNYRAMLLRCGSDIPLNICATISSLFSSDAGYEAQPSLEAELLTDSLKNKVRRFREKEIGDRLSVIFTRAAALLNLKCLLATPRPATYSPTAVGAASLHANDYLDMFLPVADASLLMAEMMPVWEIYNSRDVGTLLRRYFYIYYEILSVDSRVNELFTQHLSSTPDALRIDGLKVEDYLALLFGMYTVAATSAKSLKTSIIDLADPATVLHISAEELTAFLKERSLNEEGFRHAIGLLSTDEEFAAAVSRTEWTTDFSVFRTHPLLALKDGRFIVSDLQFLIENAAAGLFWNTFHRMPKHGRERFLSYWGDAFETYIKRIVSAHFAPLHSVLTNVCGPDFEIDILAIHEDVAVVMECKAGMISQAAKTSRQLEKVKRAIDTKLVSNEKGRPKGVQQLSRSCNALARGEVPGIPVLRHIYPLLIVDDFALSSPGTNTYLAERFASMGPHCSSISPPTVVTVDEFEELAPYLGAGDFSWAELLDRRFKSEGVDANPLRNTFADVANGKVLKIRVNGVTKPAGERLAALLEEKYRELANRVNKPT